ncbi:hypothetical protein [Lacticaseibacillus kribbianus]|uniref:hypothetical protein n=1 Tax=Lacticaseibacillus kribbianus TaxID=2926292 RepID=UPI001CD7D23F|nr:hypothetical protein [Lacticaseibacillus kribbianus]
MKQLKEALTAPAIRTAQPDGVAALTGRTLFATQLINGDAALPARGSFTRVIGALSTGITVTVAGNQVTLTSHGRTWATLTPTAVDVFLAQIKAQEYSFSQTEPIYLTFVHLTGEKFDFYVRVSGGRAGKYLVDHPQKLPVHDVLGIKALALGDTEPELIRAINDHGYDKLVADTEVAFLGADNIARGYQLAAVTPH